jgi:hypothetical protein
MSKRDRSLDEFLAAPDAVRANETERRKYQQRKAKDRAEEERERARKSQVAPTIEDMLADLIRCAEDEYTNPYAHMRTLSRKRYRLYGHYPIEFIDREFGQFEHAKQVAGLEDQPGTRTKKAAIAEASRRAHAGRYIERYIHPHRYDPSARAIEDTELWLSISDTHATFLDPFTWWCFLRAIQVLQPDGIYLNGDILEGAEISRHPKIPGWTVPLQLEFDFAREMMRQLRSVAPDAEIIWGGGNHGIDRLAMYLTQVAPAFSGLRNLRFDKLAGVEEFGIKLAQQGTIASPAGTEDDLPGTLLHGFYVFHHGTALGAAPSAVELQTHRRSGQSGHVHRAGMTFASDEASGAISWMSTPMGCTPRAGRAYIKRRHTGWQRGFGVAFLHPSGRVHQYPVLTEDGVCTFEGHVIQADIPEPDPSKLWITDFKLPS